MRRRLNLKPWPRESATTLLRELGTSPTPTSSIRTARCPWLTSLCLEKCPAYSQLKEASFGIVLVLQDIRCMLLSIQMMSGIRLDVMSRSIRGSPRKVRHVVLNDYASINYTDVALQACPHGSKPTKTQASTTRILLCGILLESRIFRHQRTILLCHVSR